MSIYLTTARKKFVTDVTKKLQSDIVPNLDYYVGSVMKRKKKRQPKRQPNRQLDCQGIQLKNSRIGKITFLHKTIPDWDGHI